MIGLLAASRCSVVLVAAERGRQALQPGLAAVQQQRQQLRLHASLLPRRDVARACARMQLLGGTSLNLFYV